MLVIRKLFKIGWSNY